MGEQRSIRRVVFSGLGLMVLGPLLFLASCRDGGPLGPDTSSLEVIAVLGDAQGAEPGARLPVPLKVRVQTLGNGAPEEDVRVRWEVLEGSGAALDSAVTVTDSIGIASTRLTLGPSLGSYRIRASIRGMTAPPAEFVARAILMPELLQIPSEPVHPGDTIPLTGSNFDTHPQGNVVTFSSVRGEVISATPTQIQVEVPPCLPPRSYQVRVRLGGLATEPQSLAVAGEPSPLVLSPGEDLTLDASEGLECFYLPADPLDYYLVVAHSTGTVGGSEHPFSLVGLTSDGLDPGPARFSQNPLPAGLRPALPFGGPALMPISIQTLDEQARWDEHLRILEREILDREGPPMGLGAREIPNPTGPMAIPQVGEERQFKVLNKLDEFEKVTARVRFVSDHTLVYVDETAPEDGFSDQDYADLAKEFENPIHAIITTAFGAESDLDGNGRVIILFTPAVNRLTDPGSEGFVAGFFFGLDLLGNRPGSNQGEVFYAMVPDPKGEHGPAIGRFSTLNTIPAVLAHEFEHMVHFNQRMLTARAETTEALWLSEALAQMAEDLVGTAFAEAREPSKAFQYRTGNWMRAQRFLRDPSQVSLLASLPPGTLAQRGAGWLFLKQLLGRPDQEALLETLAQSTSSGTQNITESLGLGWGELIADWAGSLFLDGTAVPVRPELRVSGVNLRAVLSDPGGSYPLRAWNFGELSEVFSGTLWSSAPNYFIISPPGGGVAISASGPLGVQPEAAMGLQLLVVRLQ